MKKQCRYCGFEYWEDSYCRSCASTSKNIDPTPEEIRMLCESIQRSWTPREEISRRVSGRKPHLEVKRVSENINAHIIKKVIRHDT